ncbi:putative LSM domain, eukaryotic/archaea-type, LSM domain superfamily protein [Helianthus anomalus]
MFYFRTVVGTLRGFDQFMNLVIDNTVEVNDEEKNEISMVRWEFILMGMVYQLIWR